MSSGIVAQITQTINCYPDWRCEIAQHGDFDILLKEAPPNKVELYGRRLVVELPVPLNGAWGIPTVCADKRRASRVIDGMGDTVLVVTNPVTWFLRREALANLLLAKQSVADPEMAVLMDTVQVLGQGSYGIAVLSDELDTIALTTRDTEALTNGA